MSNLLEIFNLLEPNESDKLMIYKTLSFPLFPNHRIGKNKQGKAVLFIAVDTISSELCDINLQNFSINFNVNCQINDELVGVFTIITYTGDLGDLQTYFLNLCYQIIITIGNNPQQKEVHNQIYRLIELLKFANQPPIKSIQGLWAELLIIEQANDIPLFIKSWHTAPADKYDFTYQTQHLEVKSTRDDKRIHHFSIEQITPIENESIFIASVIVKHSSNGISLNELLDKIKCKILNQIDLQNILNIVIVKTLGKAILETQKMKFNYEIARKSIFYYDSANIPNINISNIPKEITDIHFKIDLTDTIHTNHFLFKN